MPWIPYSKPPGESPARYDFPYVILDEIVLGSERALDYAKNKRKECSQLREGLLIAQKLCTKETRELARSISDMASEYMKQQRAWGFLIRWMGDDEKIVNWRRSEIQEEIASYLDRACNEMTFGDFAGVE